MPEAVWPYSGYLREFWKLQGKRLSPEYPWDDEQPAYIICRS